MDVKSWPTRAAVYFGLADDEDAEHASTGLSLYCRALVVQAAWAAALTIVVAAGLVGAFGRDPSAVATGSAAGAVVFGALVYFVAVRPQLPKGQLQTAPPDAPWERPDGDRLQQRTLRWVLGGASLIGLTWLADWWDVSSFLFPGLFMGHAVADVLGAWRVRRWEQRHRSRVAVRRVNGKEQLLAVAPVGVAAR